MRSDPTPRPAGADVPTLSTARFTLRRLRRDDAAALLPTLGDDAQCLYLSRGKFGSEEELWGWLADPSWPGLTWIAVDGAGEVVGRIVAVPQDEGGVFEIGYITCADRQGEGIASECTRAMLSYLFHDRGARLATAEVDAENLASIRILERLGFRREALRPAFEVTHKGVCDVAFYALGKDAYSAGPHSE